MLAVDLYICFPQLQEEGPVMIIWVVTNLNRGRPVQAFSTLLLVVLSGVIPVDFGKLHWYQVSPKSNNVPLYQDICFITHTPVPT